MEQRQADPPGVDQQLADARTASRTAQLRIRELEAQVNTLRAAHDVARRWAARWKDRAVRTRALLFAIERQEHVYIAQLTAERDAALRQINAMLDTSDALEALVRALVASQRAAQAQGEGA